MSGCLIVCVINYLVND